ncbi:MAG: hypothetical protein KKC84_07325 [Candidatus Omnitrophica bacterium]|nr:hypothetical protein [Candidatus Omnitrophota bacterium]
MRQQGFNPRARWDRQIPPEGTDHSGLSPEKIEVTAHFKAGIINPQCFIWNKKEYSVSCVNYRWQERRGQEIITYFAVSCPEGLYQISFNNTGFSWRLDKIL